MRKLLVLAVLALVVGLFAATGAMTEAGGGKTNGAVQGDLTVDRSASPTVLTLETTRGNLSAGPETVTTSCTIDTCIETALPVLFDSFMEANFQIVHSTFRVQTKTDVGTDVQAWSLVIKEATLDEFGYNYTSGIFNGICDGINRAWEGSSDTWCGAAWADNLVMQWSDNWFCGNPGLNCDPTGSWETNHWRWEDSSGIKYSEFYKIAYTGPGSPLWGNYTIILHNLSDTDPTTALTHEIVQPQGYGQYK